MQVNIKSRSEPGLLNVLGSPVHLSKTLMTLVSNGVEAIPAIDHVTISTENCYINRPVKGYDVVNEGDYVALPSRTLDLDYLLKISVDFSNRSIPEKKWSVVEQAWVWLLSGER